MKSKKIEITESQLRTLVREALQSGTHAVSNRPIDLTHVEGEVKDLSYKAASILKDALGIEIDDNEWNSLGVPNRLANKLSLVLRQELNAMGKEWEHRWSTEMEKTG